MSLLLFVSLWVSHTTLSQHCLQGQHEYYIWWHYSTRNCQKLLKYRIHPCCCCILWIREDMKCCCCVVVCNCSTVVAVVSDGNNYKKMTGDYSAEERKYFLLFCPWLLLITIHYQQIFILTKHFINTHLQAPRIRLTVGQDQVLIMSEMLGFTMTYLRNPLLSVLDCKKKNGGGSALQKIRRCRHYCQLCYCIIITMGQD